MAKKRKGSVQFDNLVASAEKSQKKKTKKKTYHSGDSLVVTDPTTIRPYQLDYGRADGVRSFLKHENQEI
jgi:hypothetical protein